MAKQNLEIEIRVKDSASGQTQKIKGNFADMEKGLGSLNQALGVFGLAMGTKEVVEWGMAAVEAAKEARAAQAELTAALESTGQASAEYQAQLQAQATALQDTTLFTDEAIVSAEATLATFRNLGTVTPQVIQVVTDMGQAMGNLGSAAELAGKLLDNPAQAAARAQRAGIMFTDQQKAQIAAMMEVNDVAGAQGIILDELTRKYGGQAVAAREAAGASHDLAVSYGELQESSGNLLLALGNSKFGEESVDLMNQIKASIDAYVFVLNEALPAMQAHKVTMAEQAAQTILTAQSYDELATATDAAGQDTAAFQSALLANVSTHEQYQAAVDKVAQSNIQLAGQLDLTAEGFDAAKEAVNQAAIDSVVASGQWVSSLRAMDIAIAQTASKLDELAQIGDSTLAVTTQALDAQSARWAGMAALTRTQGEAGRDMLETMAGGSTLTQQEAMELAERTRLQEEAAEDQQKIFQQSNEAMVQSVSQLGSQISSAVSGAISGVNQDVIGQLLGIDNAEANAGEAVRRMAAVAAGGIQNEWAPALASQLTGVKDATAQAFVAAFSTGDDAALKATAQQLALNPIVELFDANAIAAQVEQRLRTQNLTQALNDKVNALLGEKGLPAVQTITQQVTQAATDTGTATGAVQQSTADMAAGAEAAGETIKTAFDAPLTSINTLITRIEFLIKMLERAGAVAQNTAGSIAGLNPPAAGGNGSLVPSDAQRKMGGPVAQ